ncbi:MAG TPA: 50S ribosomal protein L10 [Candidatus Altiarchaeales archaeon]|mgnify:CR=1 FL=1|nr:50S ribosomal protein L10 [Candidatus Altiarchaeales archaeon]
MVASWKEQLVGQVGKNLKDYGVCGVVDITGVPSKQFQQIRKTLGNDVKVVIGRKRLLQMGLDENGVKNLDDYLNGSVGLVFTNLDPFQLERKLYSCMSSAAAKPGQIAPTDIVINEGDTGLPAGPVIGEIQGAGIKAKIEGGKIMILKTSTVVHAGEPISDKIAPVLKRLNIEPIKIMLKLAAAYDGKTVYSGDVLHIDAEEVFGRFMLAHQMAFNLAYNAGYFTKHTILLLLQKAFMDALNLSLNSGIINKETLPTFLSKANAQAKALKALVPDEIKSGLVEEKPPEKTPTGEDAVGTVEEKASE